MSDARLESAARLRAEVQRYNHDIAVQRAVYDQYVDQLAQHGLTPDLLEQRIAELNNTLHTSGETLDRELARIGEQLNVTTSSPHRL